MCVVFLVLYIVPSPISHSKNLYMLVSTSIEKSTTFSIQTESVLAIITLPLSIDTISRLILSKLAPVAKPNDLWITPTEKAAFKTTPNYNETVDWLKKLTTASPLLSMVSIGKSVEQREIYMEAFREGAANCTTSLKLFKNNEFKELNVCFRITSAEGTYSIENDTVYFSTTILPKGSDRYYDYAFIRKFENRSEIVRRYKNDTIQHSLFIVDDKFGFLSLNLA